MKAILIILFFLAPTIERTAPKTEFKTLSVEVKLDAFNNDIQELIETYNETKV